MEQQVIIEQAPWGRNTDWLSIAFRGLGFAALSVWLGGCSLLGLSEEVIEFQRDSPIGGQISGVIDGAAPIHVSVHDLQRRNQVHSYMSLRPARGDEGYFFMLPPGRYRVLAFQDLDGDRQRGLAEPAGAANDGAAIVIGTQQVERYDLDIRLDPATALPMIPDLTRAHPDSERPAGPATLGSITTMDNPNFNDRAARLGLWRPRRFIDEITGGLFFLEPYATDKIPVLFVHGALGHPGNWREAVAMLDRERFQPWLYYYPTAAKLEESSRYLAWFIDEMRKKHGFERLHLVAHSMGGLVALRTTQLMSGNGDHAVERLVTMSTPWRGNRGAAIGVQLTEHGAPSWNDMAPGSKFLATLAKASLPEGLRHTLLFTYNGNLTLDGSTDGAVSLSSQLPVMRQLAAERVLGFDLGHHEMLRSPLSLRAVLRALE